MLELKACWKFRLPKSFLRNTRLGKARIKLAASAVTAFISTIIDLTPGGIVATLLDRFDKDGKSGYIRF